MDSLKRAVEDLHSLAENEMTHNISKVFEALEEYFRSSNEAYAAMVSHETMMFLREHENYFSLISDFHPETDDFYSETYCPNCICSDCK